MRFFKGMLVALALAPLSANALLITPATTPQWSGNQTSQSQIDTLIAPILGDSVQLYKSEVGGAEYGSFSGDYQASYFNTPSDPRDALIEWVGGAFITDATHLLVKDGNHQPGWYLFAINWDGMESIWLRDFWPGPGAISHVAIYGGTPRQVPVPGTLSLLGAGLLLFGLTARRRSRRPVAS